MSALPGLLCAQSVFHPDIIGLAEGKGLFPFGVASGDPRQEQVVLWTKVLPDDIGTRVEVSWEIALDTGLNTVVGSGIVVTDSSSAFTVHVTATGLDAGTAYFYRFGSGGEYSAVGRTRTAPKDPESLRFAVASCANLPAGYFNGYALIAQQEDIDAVIHLGDYIYEYGNRRAVVTGHIPPHDIVTLNDYRSRYAQYRLDPALMEAHRLHPFIVIWDDHETANNCYVEGAQNHSPAQCDWRDRMAVARRAYFEWMPVEDPQRQSIIRSFGYGGLADLFMIDGRLEGRTPPVDDFNDPSRFDTSRTMLGHEQTRWLTDGLRHSRARWKVIGNPVMFSVMDFGKMAKGQQRNMDGWDGYPANRDRIFDTLDAHGIRDVLVLTGDIHTAWGIELTRDPNDREVYHRRSGRGVAGAEFVTPSITSKNLDEMKGKLVARLAVGFLKSRRRNPHLRYVNLMDHGFMVLTLTGDRACSEWVFTRTVKERTLKTRRGRAMHIMHGGSRLRRGR